MKRIALTLWLLATQVAIAQPLPNDGQDDTAELQKLIDTGGMLSQRGEYSIAGTLVIGGNKALDNTGSTLQRIGDSQDPVVRLTGNHATLRGGGIKSPNPSPKGLINIGQREEGRKGNVNWARIEGVKLSGSGGVGLYLHNVPKEVGGSNFNGLYTNLFFQGFDIAIELGEQVNAKAKASYLLDLQDCWPNYKYTDLRVRKIGKPQTSEQFRRNAEYRGMPQLECGQRVAVGSGHGVIVGHNSSANFDVLFDDDSQ